ncbi:hypothetical protein D9M68_624280 [compost metagenome]
MYSTVSLPVSCPRLSILEPPAFQGLVRNTPGSSRLDASVAFPGQSSDRVFPVVYRAESRYCAGARHIVRTPHRYRGVAVRTAKSRSRSRHRPPEHHLRSRYRASTAAGSAHRHPCPENALARRSAPHHWTGRQSPPAGKSESPAPLSAHVIGGRPPDWLLYPASTPLCHPPAVPAAPSIARSWLNKR